MKYHHEFEWDGKKAEANRRKHGVTFDLASEVLGDNEADRYHVDEYDDEHSRTEDRSITIGSHPDERQAVLTIVWVDRSRGTRRITRIISARQATPTERRKHAEKQGG